MLQTLRAHTAGGDALFSGGALLVIAVVLALMAQRPGWKSAIARWVSLAGVVLVFSSAAPLSDWLWGIWLLAYVAWRMLWRAPKRLKKVAQETPAPDVPTVEFRHRKLQRRLAAALLIAITLTCGILESGYAMRSAARTGPPADGLVVIGDSISHGIGVVPNDERWPELIGARLQIPVANHSAGGMGVSLWTRVQKGIDAVTFENPVVIVELGGNDMLQGRASLASFDRDFDALLASLVARWPAPRILVIELPLLPTYNAWGQTQRRLVAAHGVQLIPKHLFAAVLAGFDSTVDGLHLTALGHRQLADALEPWIAPFAK